MTATEKRNSLSQQKMAIGNLSLPIDFVIVGGGVSGLVCAIALRRIGHRVVVLEKNSTVGKYADHGVRLSPNMSKILYHWGLKERLLGGPEAATLSEKIHLHLFETGELLGRHDWDEELIKETRGEFVFMKHNCLLRLLYDVALEWGAVIHLGAEVTRIDSEAAEVFLSNGKKFSGNVVVGADGPYGLSRRILKEAADEDDPETEKMGELAVISGVLRRKALEAEPILLELVKHQTSLHTWFGNARSVYLYPIGASGDMTIHFCVPKGEHENTYWSDKEDPDLVSELAAWLKTAEPRLQKLGAISESLTHVSTIQSNALEEWVTDRLVCIGETVHPVPPGSLQTCALSVEDGAVLATIFSNLSNEDQIDSFLYAFQDVRLPRIQEVLQSEFGILQFMTMPPCEAQAARDEGMRAMWKLGFSPFGGPVGDVDNDSEASASWREIKDVFGYDAEDASQEWWVQWGLLRERAKGSNASYERMAITAVQTVTA